MHGTWKVLLDCGVDALPVRVSTICRRLGVGLCSFSQGYELIRRFHLAGQLPGSDGFLFRPDGTPVIFYRQDRPLCRRRFTVAHELGHLVLGHSGAPDPQAEERAANAFAAALLAPACVLRGLGVVSAPQIARLCLISPQAAHFRMQRLLRLYRQDQFWMDTRGRSCFFLSPLEWQLYCRFLPFIQATRARQRALWPRAPRPCEAARPEDG